MLRLLAEMEQVLARMQADMPARLGRPDLTTPRGADRKARGGSTKGSWAFPLVPPKFALSHYVAACVVMTRGRFRPTSGIAIFRIRPAIPPWRRSGSRNSFGIE
jgi:hypothetical protein